MGKIAKLERVTYFERRLTGQFYNVGLQVTEDEFEDIEISRSPNTEEIMNKINEIIDYLEEETK